MEKMNSDKKTARIACFLYLLVGIFSFFAKRFVDPKMYVAGDPADVVSDHETAETRCTISR
ncbi:MAG: hypothetical protein J5U19_06100 [Candidatus Methanoperedens sp.]|nr:hypothetical protein [Candidatus Methanoperedens sp.]